MILPYLDWVFLKSFSIKKRLKDIPSIVNCIFWVTELINLLTKPDAIPFALLLHFALILKPRLLYKIERWSF